MTSGQLSHWYAKLRHRKDRNVVAKLYGLDEVNLTSFLYQLVTMRNLCAHHSRLWNRNFTFTFKLPISRPHKLSSSLDRSGSRKIYGTVTFTNGVIVFC